MTAIKLAFITPILLALSLVSLVHPAPALTLYNSSTVNINSASGGATALRGPDGALMKAVVRPGTELEINNTIFYPNNSTSYSLIFIRNYSITLNILNISGLEQPAPNVVPKYAFSLEINGSSSTPAILVNSSTLNQTNITVEMGHNTSWSAWRFETASLSSHYSGSQYIVKGATAYNYANRTQELQLPGPETWVLAYNYSAQPTAPTTAPTTTVPSSPSRPSANTYVYAAAAAIVIIILVIAGVAYKRRPPAAKAQDAPSAQPPLQP